VFPLIPGNNMPAFNCEQHYVELAHTINISETGLK